MIKRFIIAVLAVMVVALAAMAVLRSRDPHAEIDSAAASALSPEAARFMAQRNAGLAALDAGDLPRADSCFLEIVTSAHGEPVGTRNLAITRVLAVQESQAAHDSTDFSALQGRANKALKLEKVTETVDPLRSLLDALVVGSLDEQHRATSLLNAFQDGLQHPAVAFMLLQSHRSRDIRAQQQRIEELLAERAPFNIAAQLGIALQKLASHNPKATDAARHLQQLTNDLVKCGVAADAAGWMNDIKSTVQSAASQRWEEASADLKKFAESWVNQPVMAHDRQALELDPRRYAEIDYSDGFYSAFRIPRRPPHDTQVAAKFALQPLGNAANMAQALDAALIDLDERGYFLGVLDPEGIDALRLNSADSARVAGRLELPKHGYQRIAVADLDRRTLEPELLLFGRDGIAVAAMKIREAAINFAAIQRIGGNEPHQSIERVDAIDLDGDGDLDLVAAPSAPADRTIIAWRNDGDLKFREISQPVSTARAPFPPFHQVVDWNRDGNVDLLAPGPQAGVSCGFGFGFGRFAERPLLVPQAGDPTPQRVACLAPFDADGNGSWDLLSASGGRIEALLTSLLPSGLPQRLRIKRVADFAATGLLPFDCDNDGLTDFIAWNADSVRGYRGEPGGLFHEVEGLIPQKNTGRRFSCGDFDGDGDLDLLSVGDVGTQSPITLLRNDVGGHHWIDVRSDSGAGAGPHTATIANVEIRLNGYRRMQAFHGNVAHFGIGLSPKADVVRVEWTDGRISNVLDVSKNQTVRVGPPTPKPKTATR